MVPRVEIASVVVVVVVREFGRGSEVVVQQVPQVEQQVGEEREAAAVGAEIEAAVVEPSKHVMGSAQVVPLMVVIVLQQELHFVQVVVAAAAAVAVVVFDAELEQDGAVLEDAVAVWQRLVLVQVLVLELDEFDAGDVVDAVVDVAERSDVDCSDNRQSFACLVGSTAQLSLLLGLVQASAADVVAAIAADVVAAVAADVAAAVVADDSILHDYNAAVADAAIVAEAGFEGDAEPVAQ